jgi:hypothetical protein
MKSLLISTGLFMCLAEQLFTLAWIGELQDSETQAGPLFQPERRKLSTVSKAVS